MSRCKRTYLRSQPIAVQNKFSPPKSASTVTKAFPSPSNTNNADSPSSDTNGSHSSAADGSDRALLPCSSSPPWYEGYSTSEEVINQHAIDYSSDDHPLDLQDSSTTPLQSVDITHIQGTPIYIDLSESHCLSRSHSDYSYSSDKENICPSTPIATTPLMPRSPSNNAHRSIISSDNITSRSSTTSSKRKSCNDDTSEHTSKKIRRISIEQYEGVIMDYLWTCLEKPFDEATIYFGWAQSLLRNLDSDRIRLTEDLKRTNEEMMGDLRRFIKQFEEVLVALLWACLERPFDEAVDIYTGWVPLLLNYLDSNRIQLEGLTGTDYTTKRMNKKMNKDLQGFIKQFDTLVVAYRESCPKRPLKEAAVYFNWANSLLDHIDRDRIQLKRLLGRNNKYKSP